MKMSVWQTQYLFSGQSAVDVQQNVPGGVSNKMFFQVGWNTGRENLPRRHRRLGQNATSKGGHTTRGVRGDMLHGKF